MTPLICKGRQRLFMHRRRDVYSAGSLFLLPDTEIMSHGQLCDLKCALCRLRVRAASLQDPSCAVSTLRLSVVSPFFFIYFAAAPARPCSFLLHLSRRCGLILRRRKSFEERLPAAAKRASACHKSLDHTEELLFY